MRVEQSGLGPEAWHLGEDFKCLVVQLVKELGWLLDSQHYQLRFQTLVHYQMQEAVVLASLVKLLALASRSLHIDRPLHFM